MKSKISSRIVILTVRQISCLLNHSQLVLYSRLSSSLK